MVDNIQALEKQLETADKLVEKINSSNALAYALISSSTDEARARALSEEAYQLSHHQHFQNAPYLPGVAKSLENLSKLNFRRADYRLALSQGQEALNLYHTLNDPVGQARVGSIIGTAYLKLGDLAKALACQLESLKIFQSVGHQKGEADTYEVIAITYSNSGSYQEALTYFHKSLRIHQQRQDRYAEAVLYNDLCVEYRKAGDYENALAHGQHCLNICQDIDNEVVEGVALNSIGETYVAMGQPDKALNYLQQSLPLYQKTGLRLLEMKAFLTIGQLLSQQRKDDAALTHLQQALSIAQAIEAKQDIYECHYALAELHKQRHDYQAALNHYEQFHAVKESVFNAEADEKFKKLEVLHHTETAQQEAEIYRLRTEVLEREVAERKRVEVALINANDALKSSNAELDAFAHTVAHDLKAPLSALIINAELLQLHISHDRFEQVNALADGLLDKSYTLSNLIDELLVLSTVRKEEVKLAPIEMNHIIHRVRHRLAHMIEQHQGQVILPDTWPTALGYAPWLEEVWANYISNGLKYGGKTPRLELGANPVDENTIRFWVRDNGPGIAPNLKAKLFTEFTRLGEERRDSHGLGLSIVKRIVEKLGGEVGVETQWGRGSLFYFTLTSAL